MKNHIIAILWKQFKDTFKNKEILIQFAMFPILTVVMESAIQLEGLPEHFFANLFAVMYIGMAPLTCAAAIISEEKEKNTLRVLQLSNVRAMEFLIGNGVYIWGICLLGSLVIGIAGGYGGAELAQFMTIMSVGHLCSIVLGAGIGLFSKNQMSATSLTVPVMLVFSFLPMLSMFNEQIGKIAQILYSQQLYLLLSSLPDISFSIGDACILLGNMVLIIGMFLRVYHHSPYR